MDGMIRLALPAAGIALLFFYRKRWLNDLLAPMTWGGWLIASCWAAFPVALFFVGLLIEKGRMYSTHGIWVVCSVLLVIWGVTGFPTVFFGAFKAIKSSQARKAYARKHGLHYFRRRVENDLFPKSIAGFINDHLSNALEVDRSAYIATTVRDKGKKRGGLRGADIVISLGTSVRGPIAAMRRKAPVTTGPSLPGTIGRGRELQYPLADNLVEFNDAQYLILVSDKIKSLLPTTDEQKTAISTAKEVVLSILHLIAQQGNDLLHQTDCLYVCNGRIIVELSGFLGSDDQLDAWVSYTKRIGEWSPPGRNYIKRPK